MANKASESKKPEVDRFMAALRHIATAGETTSREAVESSKATKPSLHTRFVLRPVAEAE